MNGQQPKPPGVGVGGLDAFYWSQIFALDSAFGKTQEFIGLNAGFLT